MKNILAFCSALCLLLCQVAAQDDFHIIPYIANGDSEPFTGRPGEHYITTIAVRQSFTSATCLIEVSNGIELTTSGSDRFSSGTFQVSDERSFWSARTLGTGSLSTGYATLECDDWVQAYATFTEYIPSPNDSGYDKLAEAAVFSSESGFLFEAEMVVDTTRDSRLAMALTNIRGLPELFTLEFGGLAATIEVPGRSQRAFFLDEVIDVPREQVSLLRIQSDSFDGSGAIGLRYKGGIFSTVPVFD